MDKKHTLSDGINPPAKIPLLSDSGMTHAELATLLAALLPADAQIREGQHQPVKNTVITAIASKIEAMSAAMKTLVAELKYKDKYTTDTLAQIAATLEDMKADITGGEVYHTAPPSESIITMTTAKAVGEKIRLWFDQNDMPMVERAYEIDSEINDGWLIKTYRLTSQYPAIKGKVTKLCCGNEQLTALDVSRNPQLTELECYANQLTTLDVSRNTNLTRLHCYANQLATLNVSRNSKLTFLSCFDNRLTCETLLLPTVSSACMFFKGGPTDIQQLCPAQAAAIRAKGWNILWNNGSWEEYPCPAELS